MGPACHPLCAIKFLFLDYCWLLIFGHLPFSFDLMPPLKRWGSYWLVGPASHPLCRIKVSFLGVIFTPNFWLLSFSFDPVPPWKRWDRCCKMGHVCHPLCAIKFLFLELFFGTWYLVTCLFLSIPCRLWNIETAAAKWDPHVILYEK